MPTYVRALAALAAVTLVVACAPKADPVTYVDQPVMSEPETGGKYN